MKRIALFSFALLMLGSVSASADTNSVTPDNGHHHKKHFRVDCRFMEKDRDSCDNHNDCSDNKCCHKPKHCVASATYEVWSHRDDEHKTRIKDISYGVRCNGDIVFSNEGKHFAITRPNGTTEDHIRPLTSNVPDTVILADGALVHPGTYEAILFLEQTTLKNGSCDVTEVDHRD